jgi:pyruvate/2-oxoglutarate dehydrogenase complex dihydrolipoamide acyltransferase (E2) component
MKLFAYLAALVVVLAALFQIFKPAESTSQATVAGSLPATASADVPVPAPATASAPATAPAPAPAPAPANDAADVRIDLVYAGGKLASGPTVSKAKQDDRISLSVTSDTADELHLHGVNLHLQLKPGQKATLDFVATKTGRFVYELHHADIELGAIEVYPR